MIPHWGIEHRREIQFSQREFAEQILAAGAHFIAGSGPHTPQRDDRVLGKPVFYSLGNLVFDQAGPGPNWRRGQLVVVHLDESGRILRVETKDFQLPDDF